jgi:hypothetical protein
MKAVENGEEAASGPLGQEGNVQNCLPLLSLLKQLHQDWLMALHCNVVASGAPLSW